MTAAQSSYRGVDSRGVSRTGVINSQVALWVYLRFDAGWRQLSVTRDEIEVGRIYRDENGRRLWWAES